MKKIIFILTLGLSCFSLSSCDKAKQSHPPRDKNCKCTPDCYEQKEHCGCRLKCPCRSDK